MCSISGLIYFKNNMSLDEKEICYYKLIDIIIKAEDRGRDSFGVSFIGEKTNTFKYIKRPSEAREELEDLKFNLEDTKIILNNNRAEPTTEYVENKTLFDVQPFFAILF